jgi:hypothetical protein
MFEEDKSMMKKRKDNKMGGIIKSNTMMQLRQEDQQSIISSEEEDSNGALSVRMSAVETKVGRQIQSNLILNSTSFKNQVGMNSFSSNIGSYMNTMDLNESIRITSPYSPNDNNN